MTTIEIKDDLDRGEVRLRLSKAGGFVEMFVRDEDQRWAEVALNRKQACAVMQALAEKISEVD